VGIEHRETTPAPGRPPAAALRGQSSGQSGSYLFDHAWPAERARLESLQAVLDPGTLRVLDATGVGPGWRCLEVGGGAGSVAAWLCDRVGPDGRVLATDLQTEFLETLGLANLEVRRHDVVADPLEEAAFELIHTRLVLSHLPDRDAVLARLARALTPGGWLVVEDFAWSRPALVSARSDRRVSRTARLLPGVMRLLISILRRAGYDPRYGARLPAELARLGLVDVGAEGRAVVIRGGSPEAALGRLTLTRLGALLEEKPAGAASGPLSPSRLLGTMPPVGRRLQKALDDLISLFDDPSVFLLAPAMVAATGRRPTG
jgi:SAM-dependent methyltransferase